MSRTAAPHRADIVCHSAGGLLLSLVVIKKAHYVYGWLIFPFFRCALSPRLQEAHVGLLVARLIGSVALIIE